MHKLKILNTTTRPSRKGPIIASWAIDIAKKHGNFEVEFLDLAVINLPFMDEPVHPRFRKYEHEHTKKWSATIDSADAFIIVTAEYNYSFPAPIKNALDYLLAEWAYKPVAFVSYGGVSGGTRAVQMLKQVVTTLKMTPVVEAVNLPFFEQFIVEGVFNPNEITSKAGTVMLNELNRWAEALKPMRTKQH